MQLASEPSVGLIDAETFHRFRPGHAREFGGQVHSHGLAESIPKDRFPHVEYILFLDEGHFHVQLGKFRLTIRTQVLVPEAPSHLEIAVETSDHQDLLENLR